MWCFLLSVCYIDAKFLLYCYSQGEWSVNEICCCFLALEHTVALLECFDSSVPESAGVGEVTFSLSPASCQLTSGVVLFAVAGSGTATGK